jgi:hypothetical protein
MNHYKQQSLFKPLPIPFAIRAATAKRALAIIKRNLMMPEHQKRALEILAELAKLRIN